MELMKVQSSWVDAIAYDGGDLFVRYKDKEGKPTVLCKYEGITLDQWIDFLGAPSKGQWIHANIIKHPYTIVA
jgi:hypothetical protein